MRLSEGNPFKIRANPQAHNQTLSRANVYENEMVETYHDSNCSGASLSLGGLFSSLSGFWSDMSPEIVDFSVHVFLP